VLKRLESLNRRTISTSDISRALKLDPTQVRKDLSYTGVVGKPRVGYNLQDLQRCIQSFLGWDKLSRACLVGVGHLGTALLGYDRFNEYGICFAAAFDTDPAKVGCLVHDREVRHLDELPEMAQNLDIRLGILTVPASVAQEVADLMVKAGIQAIWNFTPISLNLEDGIIVEKAQIYASLAVLSRRLEARIS